MTVATIIRQAKTEGVSLALSATGGIKVAGDRTAVNRWLPVIREQKPGIVKALLEANASCGDLGAIRAWLAFIGENDLATIGEVLDKCRTDTETRDYYMRRAGE